MAGSRPIVWSFEAESDLADIWSYYHEVAGPRIAEARIREIAAACRILEQHGFAGRARDDIRPGLRSVLATPHVIFYRLRDDTVQIVRILDGRRDIEDIFADET